MNTATEPTVHDSASLPSFQSPTQWSPTKSPKRAPRRLPSPASTVKRRAHRTLASFYRRVASSTRKTKKKLEFACRDSAICLILGTNLDAELRKFFAGFVKFRFLEAATRLKKKSANGFVDQLRYAHHGYEAHAVLKSVVRPSADSAVYEFLVGNYVNALTRRFPCFVETYGLFKYNGLAQWTAQKDDAAVSAEDCKARLKNVPYAGTTAALHAVLHAVRAAPERFAVLVQSIPTPIYIAKLRDDSNLLPVLFQIYYPLGLLQADFTHYDLHKENVLLYEPARNKYIEYHYHTPAGVVRFKSNYLAKIIDYGRCHFDDSRDIYRTLIALHVDARQCGFGWLNPGNSSDPYFTSSKADPRYDLRYFQYVKDYLNPTKKGDFVYDLTRFEESRALIPPDFPLADYRGGPCQPDDICDCAGASAWLAQTLPTLPDRFQGQEKFGDLHVRPDAPFVFTLA